MLSYRAKVYKGLVVLQNTLATTVKEAATGGKKSCVAKLTDAINMIGSSLKTITSSEKSLLPVKKAILPIQNTLTSLLHGIQSGDIDSKEAKKILKNVETKFLPKLQESLEEAARKLADGKSRLKNGILQTDAAIIEELEKAASEIGRLASMLSGLKTTDAGKAFATVAKSRLTLIRSTAESLPAGEMLDHSYETLKASASTIATIVKRLDAKILIKASYVDALKADASKLTHEVTRLTRLAKSSLLEYEDTGRSDVVVKDMTADDVQPSLSPDASLRGRISDLKAEKQTLPARLGSLYEILNLPIAPIFNVHDAPRRDRPLSGGTVTRNFSMQSTLDKLGIQYVMVEDYPVLKNQRVLAIDKKRAQELISKYQGRKKATDEVYVNLANIILDELNRKTNLGLVLVSKQSTANPRNTNITLFWVMPARTLNTLIQRGWSKLSMWSLPFDS